MNPILQLLLTSSCGLEPISHNDDNVECPDLECPAVEECPELPEPVVIDPCGEIPVGRLMAEWDFEAMNLNHALWRDTANWDFGSSVAGWGYGVHDWSGGAYGTGDFNGHERDFMSSIMPYAGTSTMALTNPTRDYTVGAEAIHVRVDQAIWPGAQYAFIAQLRVDGATDVPVGMAKEFSTSSLTMGVEAYDEFMVTNDWQCAYVMFDGATRDYAEMPAMYSDQLTITFGAVPQTATLYIDQVRLVLLSH